MNDGGDGTKAGLAEAMGDQPRERQMALLPDEAAAAEPVEGKRRGGRPKGARNRRTEELVVALKGKHGGLGPLEAAFARVMADPKALATELGMKVEEVWKHQNQLIGAILPYVEQKRPVSVEVDATRRVQVVLAHDALPDQLTDEGVVTLDMVEIKSELNQGLTEDEE